MLIYLASQSPRRMELLRQMQVPFTAINPDIDESLLPAESPADYVSRMAINKAQRGWTMVAAEPAQNDKVLVIAADTIVLLDDTVLGKPANRQQAIEMLLALSGTTHEVMTSVCVLAGNTLAGDQPGLPEQTEQASSVSRISFGEVSPEQADWYWQTGEPADKAGAYAIQGLAGIFVSRIEGSYSGVVGLPVYETGQLLERCGWSVLSGENN